MPAGFADLTVGSTKDKERRDGKRGVVGARNIASTEQENVLFQGGASRTLPFSDTLRDRHRLHAAPS